ncbi:M16 family metallopeptidase [Cyclobacterium marinum]|uniref:Peptidase M16 domain protein n=1 Tax=Cyclobacterium marinum (strain ATCC 25205 / DSM 745 / LMG 13164 / NCIMB 1802) TaxID=880070 RepID=G0IYD3_CYCMS|nr:pitrilysin family protein [Cyclobacterium marinum]AEL25668.1 peptidase M16 domain protein [Cyclobacterium marinum DSM 745]
MKTLYIILFAAFITFGTQAQVDRSVLPPPGPAPKIEFTDPATFTLDNGLKVFVVPNNKLPRVAFYLILNRDPLFEGDNAGLTGFVGDMMMAGTSSRTKEELDEEIDFIGASLGAGSTSLSASSLKKHQGKVLELMTDVLYNPIFPQEELEKLKKQTLTSLASSKDDPDYLAGVISNALVYGKEHPYGETMTEETVENVNLEDIKEYYRTYFKPNIAYLAIVGDITDKEAKNLVNDYFSSWEKGKVPTFDYQKPELPAENKVALLDRSSAVQSVINIAFPVEMHLTNPDYMVTRVMNFILGEGFNSRLNGNLRETKGYTYGARSSFGSDKLIAKFSAGTSVRNEVTDSSVYEMIYEIRNLKENGITEEELTMAKANLSGRFGRSLENPNTIATFAINIDRYNLPEDFYSNYLQRLDALTVEDINQVAAKYLKPENMYITVVGNGAAIKEGLAQFGEISMYNYKGDEVQEIQLSDASKTATDIISDYLEAIGGVTAVEAIKTAKLEMTAEVQGTKLEMMAIHDMENQRLVQQVVVMGNVASKTLVKDGKATVSSMGKSQSLTDEQYEDVKMASLWLVPELYYETMGYSLSLDGAVDLDGESAYKVIVSNPTGGQVVNFYSIDSGLKLKSENQLSGDVSYQEYQEFEGVQVPVKMSIKSPMLPVPLETQVNNVELNLSVSDQDFN